jgi:hypothetical protein
MLMIVVLLEYLASTAPVCRVEKAIHTANMADADQLGRVKAVGAVRDHVLVSVNQP